MKPSSNLERGVDLHEHVVCIRVVGVLVGVLLKGDALERTTYLLHGHVRRGTEHGGGGCVPGPNAPGQKHHEPHPGAHSSRQRPRTGRTGRGAARQSACHVTLRNATENAHKPRPADHTATTHCEVSTVWRTPRSTGSARTDRMSSARHCQTRRGQPWRQAARAGRWRDTSLAWCRTQCCSRGYPTRSGTHWCSW